MSDRRTWYHTIDLPDGSSTPGWFDTREIPRRVPWPNELRGGRCLDVGTFDGFFAFEMERRGAGEVVAIDVDDPYKLDWAYDRREWGPNAMAEWGSERGPGFFEAARLLKSSVKRVDRSIYELSSERDGMFDVVLCGALLLHLRDPVLGLERMREVCRGKLVLIESLDPALDLFARRIPAAQLGPQPDEWWRVNRAGMHRMVELAGFRIVETSKRFVTPKGPGAPKNLKLSALSGILSGRPGQRGLLTQIIVAVPRPPTNDR